MCESELGTAFVIPHRPLVLIEVGYFHEIAACIPDSSRFDDSTPQHDGFAIRAKVGLQSAPMLIPLDRLPGKGWHPIVCPAYSVCHQLTMQIEEAALDDIAAHIVAKAPARRPHAALGD